MPEPAAIAPAPSPVVPGSPPRAPAPIRPAASPPDRGSVDRFTATPQARYAADQRATAEADPWTSSRTLTRDANGQLVQHDATPATDTKPADKPADAKPADVKPATPAPDGTEKFQFGEDLQLTRAEIDSLRATHAAMESRRLTAPATPDAYEIKLSPDFKPPAGFEDYRPDSKHPLMQQARELVHAIDQGKLSGQAALSKILDLNAAQQIGTAQMLKTARDAEVSKLGAAGQARVTAVENFLNSKLGDDTFKQIRPLIATAKIVEVFERWLSESLGGSGSNFSATRSAEAPKTIDDATWAKMSYSQQKDYAENASRATGRR
jgi:hypothetical protein